MALSEMSKAIRTVKMETDAVERLTRYIAECPESATNGIVYVNGEESTFVSNGSSRLELLKKKLAGSQKRLAAAQAIVAKG